MKSGDEIEKPKILCMAPTANAAMIVGGKTIESALAINPKNKWNYVKASDERQSNMKFLYEDIKVVFTDEISMCGTNKLTVINFRMQDYSEGSNKMKFMGNRSFIACGDLRFVNYIFFFLFLIMLFLFQAIKTCRRQVDL